VAWRWTLLLLVLLAGCGGGKYAEPSPDDIPPGIKVTSPAFAPGGPMPKRFSCDGAEVSPPLAWSGVPKEAKSLVLVMEDPDAPGGTYVHWTLYGIAPTTTGFEEAEVPPGSREGDNSFGNNGYGGPCPPGGDKAHHYVFKLYALRDELDLKAGATPGEVRQAIVHGGPVRGGRLVGTFKRE
jgi:Raf kinase inhibitor-like YbhB/YbcL family protein